VTWDDPLYDALEAADRCTCGAPVDHSHPPIYVRPLGRANAATARQQLGGRIVSARRPAAQQPHARRGRPITVAAY